MLVGWSVGPLVRWSVGRTVKTTFPIMKICMKMQLFMMILRIIIMIKIDPANHNDSEKHDSSDI